MTDQGSPSGDASSRGDPDPLEGVYRSVYRRTPAMMHSVDGRGRIVAVSDEWLRVLGYSRDEVLGRSSADFLNARSRDFLHSVGDREFTEAAGVREVPYTFVAKDGREVHVLLSAIGERREDGTPARTLVVLQDVSERREVERVRDRLIAILETTPQLVGVANLDRRIVYINPAGARMVGRDREEMVGTPIGELHPPGEAERIFRDLVPTALSEGHWSDEVQVVGADGDFIPVHMTALVHSDPEDRPEFFSAIMSDLRERKLLEAQVRRSQKMGALGRLAGGIAHDFNNILNVITGVGQILAEELPAGGPLRPEVDDLLGATKRATALTKQLLAFGRGQLMRPEVVDTGAMVREHAAFIQRLLGERHPITVEVEDGTWPVEVDPVQLQQVLMNLGLNARDAMPGGGQIEITVRNTSSAEATSGSLDGLSDDLPDEVVEIVVRDEGDGIDPELRERIFEPFFTTREEGEGTGLGLTTAYGIVRQSGGRIDVRSEPGEWTEFSVLLPRATASSTGSGAARPDPAVGAPAPYDPESDRVGRILLVEDDDAVRSVLARILDRAGHGVVEVSNAPAALEILGRKDVDVLLTDAVMPGMDGAQLIEEARAMHPGLRIILMSGHLRADVAGGLSGDFEFLQKPVDAEDLRHTLSRLLSPTYAGPGSDG